MKTTLASKVTRGLSNISRVVGKHSPLIMTAIGVVGLGATAVTSYKAAKKVEVIVEDIEESREQEERIAYLEDGERSGIMTVEARNELMDLRVTHVPVDRFEVGKRLTGAVALPVALGVASIACIILSYKIQDNRIGALAAALTTATAENAFYKKKYAQQYGEEKAKQFYTPTEMVSRTVVDDNGKESDILETIQSETSSLHGVWFHESTEYASDDHAYNQRFIQNVEDKMTNKLFATGWLRMNEVCDALGLPRTRAGELLGWGVPSGDFRLDQEVTLVYDEVTRQNIPQIYIKWNNPKYIYDDVEYKWN